MNRKSKRDIELMRRQMEISGFYASLSSLLMLDNWTALPPNGQAYRQRLTAFLAEQVQQHTTSDVIRDLVTHLSECEFENETEQALYREMKREYELSVAIPVEKQAELARLCAEAQPVWKDAHEKADFSLFRPYLDRIFRLNREVADLIGLPGHPLNSLAARYEAGIDVQEVDALFKDLRQGIVSLLQRVQSSDVSVDNGFLALEYDKRDVFDFTRRVVERMGYDPDSGGYGEVIHPFCALVGPSDARITSNYSSFSFGLWAGMHEAGHGMYALNGASWLAETGMYGGIRGSVHESQSRFYENMIGKSRELWSFLFPEAQKRFPQLGGISLEDFYRGINKVEPTLIRIRADELTYSLHPIIRFEIEKELLEDRIKIEELPDAWNAKYKEYLGIEPANDREGVLQDVHWSLGMVGYFQSYALGNLYGGQFLDQLKKDVPNAISEIAHGDFAPVNSWLIANIHQAGRLHTPEELVKQVTGRGLSAQYFLDYLQEKYVGIYQLD